MRLAVVLRRVVLFIGAVILADLCKQIETGEEPPGHLDKLEREFERVCTSLQDILAETKEKNKS